MIAADLGRLFEVGFNLGILAYLQQNNISHKFGDLYRHDLQQLKLPKILKRIVESEEMISNLNIQIVDRWSQYLLQKGFLGGLNFFQEYLKSTGWSQGEVVGLAGEAIDDFDRLAKLRGQQPGGDGKVLVMGDRHAKV